MTHKYKCPSPACYWRGAEPELSARGYYGQRPSFEWGELGFCPACKYCIREGDEVEPSTSVADATGYPGETRRHLRVDAPLVGPEDNSDLDNLTVEEALPTPPPNILREADRLTGNGGERNDSYDHPYPNFSKIAAAWNVLLGDKLEADITPRNVAHMMIAMKLVRDTHKAKRDNLVDIAGYARCAERLEEWEERDG